MEGNALLRELASSSGCLRTVACADATSECGVSAKPPLLQDPQRCSRIYRAIPPRRDRHQRLIALDERGVTFCWNDYREKGAPAIRSLPSVRMSSCAFSCSMRCPWLPPHPSVRPARQPGASESRENTELPHVTAAQRAGRCGSIRPSSTSPSTRRRARSLQSR
jgi:hypothetical protein